MPSKSRSKRQLLPSRPPGRPPMYAQWLTDEGLAQLTEWSRSGLFVRQMAKNMGITDGTFYDWQKMFPEFANAIKLGRTVTDREVENAMYQAALGYEYEEVTSERDEYGVMKVVKRVKKSQAPNVSAQIFWLKNRQPEMWRDKVEVKSEHEGKIIIEMGEMDKWSK